MNCLTYRKPIILLAFLITFFNCSKSSDQLIAEKTNITVKLSATSSMYDALNIEVQNILLKIVDDESDPNCWLDLEANNTGIYNLLDLTEGEDALLVNDFGIPKGQVFEIWLVLGDNNSVVINGETKALSMPYAHQAGLKVESHAYLEEGSKYTYLLEFDIAQSVVPTNFEDYIVLKPVVSATLQSQ